MQATRAPSAAPCGPQDAESRSGFGRGILATLAIVTLALVCFAWVTHGFVAITSDGVRRADIEHTPRALPDIGLVNAAGQPLSLADYGQASDAVTLVTLVYVRCQTVCLTSASGQSWLQAEIQARQLQGRVRLLTLSFDPSDTPDVLAQYARRLDAQSALWRFAGVREADDLPALLRLFSIVVLPDGVVVH